MTTDLGASPTGIARLREVDPDRVELAIDWLDALIRHGDRADAGRAPDCAAMTTSLPAWSEAFAADDARRARAADPPFGRLDRATVFGDADGRGVTVAIVDSGVEASIRPSVAGLARQLRVELDGDDAQRRRRPGGATDLVGHGTACAGIVAGIAPAAELVSIRMLGADNRGKGRAARGRRRVGDRRTGSRS